MRRVTSGYWIIGTAAISHEGNTETVFHPNTPAEQFDTEEEMLAAHRERFPNQYQEKEMLS